MGTPLVDDAALTSGDSAQRSAACAAGHGDDGCSTSDAPFDFAQLLAPLSVEEFGASYRERRPLLRTGCSRHHDDLFRLDEVEHAIAAAPDRDAAGERGVFGVRNRGHGLEHYAFEGQGPAGRSTAVTDRAFDEGYTIVANAVRHHHARVGRLCADMESALQHPANCNLYLTPPRAQGFNLHVDGHDTFLVQIAGAKRWRLWRPPIHLPMLGTIDQASAPDGPPDLEFDVTGGDLLYIPRGWWHEGATAAELSLHLTIGVVPLRWTDLLASYVRQLADHDVRLRATVPIAPIDRPFASVADDLWGQAVAFFGNLASRAADAHERQAMAASLLTDRLGSMPPPFESRLAVTTQRHRIGAGDPVIHRPGLRPVVVRERQGARIVFVGGFVRGPAEAEAALRFVADSPRFCARDLPGLDDELQLQLVHELVLQGLVEPERPRPAPLR